MAASLRQLLTSSNRATKTRLTAVSLPKENRAYSPNSSRHGYLPLLGRCPTEGLLSHYISESLSWPDIVRQTTAQRSHFGVSCWCAREHQQAPIDRISSLYPSQNHELLPITRAQLGSTAWASRSPWMNRLSLT